MRRLSKIKIEWSPEFAYAIGLLTTDGNLSKDKRHLNMTSLDEQLILNFKECLGLQNKIGKKARGGGQEKKYFVLQFGDRNFYDFLLAIGLKPAKSKILGKLNIPRKYFADFLRGCIDGDGNIDVHSHRESRYPQLRLRLNSASPKFVQWVRGEIERLFKPSGGWVEEYKGIYVLSYGKSDSVKLLKRMYHSEKAPRLDRKYAIAKKFLRV